MILQIYVWDSTAVLAEKAMKRIMIRFPDLCEGRCFFFFLRSALKVLSFYELFTRLDAERDRA